MFLARQEVHVRNRSILLPALLSLALVAAACGGDDDDAASDASTTAPTVAAASAFPVSVTGANGKVTIDAQPRHIVSLSPSSTEDLFAIGAGDQVVAVDDQSNYPADAPKTDLSSYEPNVEAIAKYEPDLVVSSSDDPDLVNGLDKVGVDVLVQKAAVEIDDVFDQITELGKRTGHEREANALASKMRADITDIRAKAVDRADLTAYWELDPTYYSVTSQTFIGKLLGY